MELDFKCLAKGCQFTTRFDWPEDFVDDQGRVILDGNIKIPNPLSIHHDLVKISLEAEPEYGGRAVYGHGKFVAHHGNKKIEVSATTGRAFIENFHGDLVKGLKP